MTWHVGLKFGVPGIILKSYQQFCHHTSNIIES